jgi:hypothetical protein
MVSQRRRMLFDKVGGEVVMSAVEVAATIAFQDHGGQEWSPKRLTVEIGIDGSPMC